MSAIESDLIGLAQGMTKEQTDMLFDVLKRATYERKSLPEVIAEYDMEFAEAIRKNKILHEIFVVEETKGEENGSKES